jgi:phage N-6-adenine-methyltransferase
MNTKPIFSSARHNWKTPDRVYADLNSEFGFDFDPCPSTPDLDGLECEWGNCNFLNPPYSRIKTWMQKVLTECSKGKTVVALLPSRTGTDWFHGCVLPHATEIRFIRGRLQFDDCGVNAPFDSMIVIFKPEADKE